MQACVECRIVACCCIWCRLLCANTARPLFIRLCWTPRLEAFLWQRC